MGPMQDPNPAVESTVRDPSGHQIHLLPELGLADYVLMLWRRKWLVLTCLLIGFSASLAHHFCRSKRYKAVSLIVLSHGDGIGRVANLLGIRRRSDRCLEILKSRRVSDEVIEQLGLMKHWATQSQDATRNKLAASAIFSITKGELISISVADQDPEVAARAANLLVKILGRIDFEISVGGTNREKTKDKTTIKVISEAMPPDRPVSGGLRVKLLFCLVLGLMVGVALVWFLEVVLPRFKAGAGSRIGA
jgi:uncharacterized protein involved in exopolysaccharide biosynthesis